MAPADIPISQQLKGLSLDAPTPQNTPLPGAPIAAGLSRPTVPDIPEGEDSDDGGKRITRRAFGDDPDNEEDMEPFLSTLTYPVRRRVEGMRGIQVEHAKIEKEYKAELYELEKKYHKRYTPLYERRRELLTGAKEPSEREIAAGEEQGLKDDPEVPPFSTLEPEEGGEDPKGVPEFWLTVLRNHIGIGELISVRDEEALKYLTDIRFEYLEGSSPGYKILFYFATNKFFTNEVLTKTYHYQDEVGYGGDYIYDKAVGTKIDWKEDQDLTQEVEVRKQRNKNTNRIRVIKRSRPTPSFFNFFTPPVPPTPEQLEDGAFDEHELEEIEENLELDYQIGEDLKERVIPRAIDYYTGKALDFDLDGMEHEDDEDGDGTYDDDDDDDDDEDDRYP